MSKTVITASNAGFFNTSPLNSPLAPNVFLKTEVNLHGAIISTARGWQTLETEYYDDFGISIQTDTPPNILGKLGQTVEISVSSIEYYRFESGEKVVIAIMQPPAPLKITATYDQLSFETFGWSANLGEALVERIQTEGFKFMGGSADDIFAPHLDILPIYADNIIRGKGGNDRLHGGLGDDRIFGGTGDDMLYDPGGSNFLGGQAGNDTLTLGDGSDGSIAKGGTGDDTLISGAGSDTLRGGRGNDLLLGGRGDDILFGGPGKDVLSGGDGADSLKGNAGADQFVFNAEDEGRDRIADFTDSIDLIVLHGVTEFTNLSISQHGNDSLVEWGRDASVTLADFDSTFLTTEDFLFI